MSEEQPGPAPASRRKEIQHIFDHYACGGDRLPTAGLLQFLRRDQGEASADDEVAESLIDEYEIDETEREKKMMTFNGFLRYMESRSCCVLNQEHTRVYQDMDLPLCHYFISSSHNTYLTADQLVGKSHLFAYKRSPASQCKMADAEKSLLIEKNTLYEQLVNGVGGGHPQQQVMAHYLTSILGDKLLDSSLDLSSATELPSPQVLSNSWISPVTVRYFTPAPETNPVDLPRENGYEQR
ncbi:hypothetical protein JZ751_009013 [Albula glossodonta]|uniref:phosphoinositide phospholipase C n=1 Tax=Albula glossodonta TaxID=121402 RepID=A0A8T2PAY1_9TELE|nr:hypothetical protein JZ751_009013 [Albula glossodonta]